MESVTIQEVQQLVSIRLALTDALKAVRVAGRYRRGAAVVTLDAVVEKATALVLVSRGLGMPTNGKLDDMISRVKSDLADSWKPTVLADVRQLRRARNAAQHDGLEADAEQLPVWASAASSYVKSLIAAQFNLDVMRVVFSDAIKDDELKALFLKAEQAHEAGDELACVTSARAAYNEALAQWKRMSALGRFSGHLMSTDIFDKKSYDDLKRRIDRFYDHSNAAVFGLGGAEAQWFSLAIAEQGDVFDFDDSERVLSYVFEWITGFEQARSAWITDRQERALAGARRVRSGSACASIVDFSLNLVRGNVELHVSLKDVPEDENYHDWLWKLTALLRDTGGRGPFHSWTVNLDGTTTLRYPTEALEDIPDELQRLDHALREVEEQMELAALEVRRKEVDLVSRKALIEEGLLKIQSQVPTWVESIKPQLVPETREDHWLVEVDSAIEGLAFGRDAHDRPKSLAAIVRNHELVESFFGTVGRSTFALTPVLTPEQLMTVLQSVSEVVGTVLREAEDEKNAQAIRLTAVRAKIASKIVELDGVR